MKGEIFLFPKKVEKPKLRIFCFPYAGGSASTFFPWVDQFQKEVELVFVQPPGRASRISEHAHKRMKELVVELISKIASITDVPYVFFGHSLGGRVSYELAYQLYLAGIPLPKYIIVSASRAAHLKGLEGNIYNQNDYKFLNAIKELNGTPRELLLNSELMKLLLPMLKADFEIAETYQAQEVPIPVSLHILHGDQDINVSREQLDAWKLLSTGNCSIKAMKGGHFFIDSDPESVIKEVENVIYKLL